MLAGLKYIRGVTNELYNCYGKEGTEMKKAYFNGFELEVLDFYERYNNGIPCRYAKCYIKALDSVEGIMIDSIEIK